MKIVLGICLILLAISLALSLTRLGRGRTTPDRAVALDVTTAAAMGILIVIVVYGNRVDLLPLLIILSATGFVSSTTIARFVSKDSEAESRILTWEEARALDAQQTQLKDTDQPAHQVDGEGETRL